MKKTKRIINTLLGVVVVLIIFEMVQCSTIEEQKATIEQQSETISNQEDQIRSLNDTNWCIATTPWGHLSINDSITNQNIHEADSLVKFVFQYDTINKKTKLSWKDSIKIGTTPMNLIIQALDGSYVEIPIEAGIIW